ncbi:MAG: bifunctional [glutamine synthetase] adenylyltransferase/[glutamine synthetase]-adenylyl-L-tyrosine phosphorylase, partial [Rickettsiales bacterium]|nr:bifunctional [glutamine synthetase] adenylyltransferase/[glutamine synthetase]-adenylyl-L-tyrosine phosphorylase [Rickettsiales bacterium]
MKYFPKINNENAVLLYREKLEKSLEKIENSSEIREIFYKENSLKKLNTIFSNSPYLSDVIIDFPQFFAEILQNNYQEIFEQKISEISKLQFENKSEIEEKLRIEKRKMSLLIANQEIYDFDNASIAMVNLSKFADLCVMKTAEFLLKKAHHNKIITLKNTENPFFETGLVLIAIGKLGSWELNYSSDIDLIIFFEDEKITHHGRKTIQQFYIEFAQELTDILARRTADGYVFRVDMRLRPDPASNPLAVSLAKAEKYYFTVGQNWERAAMIKSRAICGDENSIKIFFEFMDKNVWRKSLDFETIEDIHSIKRQIDTKNILDENLYNYNVKLGRGGIREIEFYAQTQQLIWGGRKPNLREKKTIQALTELAREGEISTQIATELTEAYNFYRMVEHRLQMVNDEQTHRLPDNLPAIEKISNFCGFADYKKFTETLRNYIEKVRGHYSKLFETSPSLASNTPDAEGSLIFTGAENHPDTLETLKKMGFYNPEKISDIVRGWHHGRYNCTIKARSRAVLTKLMPSLISNFSACPDPDEGFIRFDEFLSRLPTGTQIFSMLYVNPSIIELIADVMGGYPEIAETLTRNHTLLDFVLTSEFYDSMPDENDLKNNLAEHISKTSSNIAISNDEIFELIKNWANDRKFKVGIQFIRDQITSEELFINLSNIAEIVIKTLIEYIEKDLSENFGKVEKGNFAVVALGKFGSHELTFKSDLDMMFIYDFDAEANQNNKNLKIEPSAYYLRLANKLIQILSGISSTGRLYEVDLRLRPLGE